MAVITKILGSMRDLPQLEIASFGSASAGTGSDYEHPVLALPNLQAAAPSGVQGNVPYNDLYIRTLILVPEAAVTGAATNNMLFGFKQRRAGSVVNQVNTTNTASITAGSGVVVTPTGGTLMQYIVVGTVLHIAAGGGTAEDVIVTAVGAGTFTATFAFSHNAGTAITGVYLAAVWYNGSGVTEAAYTPHQLIPIPNQILPGDILTFARVSYGTGLSGGSPAISVQAEWVLLNGTLPLG